MINEKHERGLIRSFIIPQRQERYLDLLAKPRRRQDITSTLAHFKHLDMRFVLRLPSNRQHVSDMLRILRLKGAPETCYAVSEDNELDGKEVLLEEAINFIHGRGIGTFLSCIPGQLAYFEDEDERWVLERKT